jgi:hypothetical protein
MPIRSLCFAAKHYHRMQARCEVAANWRMLVLSGQAKDRLAPLGPERQSRPVRVGGRPNEAKSRWRASVWIWRPYCRGIHLESNSPSQDVSQIRRNARPSPRTRRPAADRPPPTSPTLPGTSRGLPHFEFRRRSSRAPAKAATTPHRDMRPDLHKPHSPSLSYSRKH